MTTGAESTLGAAFREDPLNDAKTELGCPIKKVTLKHEQVPARSEKT
jgi:hypothetical protein